MTIRVAIAFILLTGLISLVQGQKSCPTSPNSACDFYIEKWKFSLPLFKLKRYKNDTVISGRIYSRKNNKPAYVSSNGYCQFIPKARTNCGQQFYFRALKNFYNANRIGSRTFTKGGFTKFRNKCVRINITNARIVLSKNNFEVINEKDGNMKYKPNRRCIVFKTTIVGK